MRLRRRDRGIPSILRNSWDNTNFLDKFVSDLNEIENINNRMERDIEAKTQERIRTFGVNGNLILGIDIVRDLKSPRSLPEFPRNPYFTDVPPKKEVAPPPQKIDEPSAAVFFTDIEDPKSIRHSERSESVNPSPQKTPNNIEAK